MNERQIHQEYQTVFAKTGESVAAPTAGLHFTKRLMRALGKQGIAIEFVTLNVSLGTFATLTNEQLKSGRLHTEAYAINTAVAKRLNSYKQRGRPIVAVGTTVVRTLEAAVNNKYKLIKLSGATDLFIRPGFTFNFVDALITNFHVPKSSLLMLVSAFAGKALIKKSYRIAIKKRFRLFSFGDGMFIL